MMPRNMIRPQGYMTPNEVGQLLGVTGDTIKDRINAGKIPARRTANGYYWVRMSDAIQQLPEYEKGGIVGEGRGAVKLYEFGARVNFAEAEKYGFDIAKAIPSRR